MLEPLPCVIWKSSWEVGKYDVGRIMASIFPFILTCDHISKEEIDGYPKKFIEMNGEMHMVLYDKEIESIDTGGLRGLITITDTMLDEILFGESTRVLNNYPIKRSINGKENSSDQS